MTVGELRAKLEGQPNDREVVVTLKWRSGEWHVHDVGLELVSAEDKHGRWRLTGDSVFVIEGR